MSEGIAEVDGWVREEGRGQARATVSLAVRRAARVLLAMTAILVTGAGSAYATDYTAMLAPNTIGATETSSGSAGYVYWSQSWTAPLNLSFDGFAYTAASFYSDPEGKGGGVFAGFGGDGGSNQPTLLFPFTDDCAITNSSHLWAHNDGGGAVVSYENLCSTSGQTGGWNYDNSQILNDPGVGTTGTNYQTLWLTMFCQASECSYSPSSGLGGAGVSVTNLSGQISDPSSMPSGGFSWASPINTSAWYQTDHDGPALNLSANDQAGVCGLTAALTGPGSYSSPNYVGVPGTTDPGGVIGTEFSSDEPCGTGSASGSWTLPGNLQSGSYSVSVYASNPGNYEAQGMSQNGAPDIESSTNAIRVDDSTPSISWSNGSSQYTSSSTEELNVTVGPSGLSSVACADNGSAVAATLVSGSTSGQGTTTWSVPTTASGANQVSCTATNGDVNGALTGSSGQTFNVDATVPTVTFTDPSYTPGTWTSLNQNVTVGASSGPSGLRGIICSVDGSSSNPSSSGQVAVTGNGEHAVSCTATSNVGLQGSGTYYVWIDAEQPTASFLVNGVSPVSSWFSGTPTVQVVGSEQGGVVSGLSKIVCTVTDDGQAVAGSPFTLSTANGGLVSNTGSFTLSNNGSDLVSCVATTNAGVVQATPSTVSVNIDDPLISPEGTGTTVYGSSAQIDNGQDPYSDGPSESTWYHTAQAITITANATAGDAPISSISCKGALVGSWPIDSLDTDQAGGEQITVYVQPPGGELSCTTTDTAGNTYPLGTYLFQIDDTAPTGHFVAQGQWPAANEIEVAATDNGGSGVANMFLYATNSAVDDGAPQDLGQMTYDPATGYYEALVPDGVAPFTTGVWTFTVNTSDVAGNAGQITAGPDGGPEQLTLPLLQTTDVTASASDVQAAASPTVPAQVAADAGIDPDAAGSVKAASVLLHQASDRRALIATAARAHTDGRRSHGCRKGKRCKTAHNTSAVLKVPYGTAVTLHGSVMNTDHSRVPVDGAEVLVYEHVSGASGYRLLGDTVTDQLGQYAYRVSPGASRQLYVVFPGSKTLRPAAADLTEQTTGRIATTVSQIQAGGMLVISGRVLGGHIPAGGLNVSIDYRQAGAPGQGTLGTVRTNARGVYRFTQSFAAGTRGLVYVLWEVVAPEPGWPYVSARTAQFTRPVL